MKRALTFLAIPVAVALSACGSGGGNGDGGGESGGTRLYTMEFGAEEPTVTEADLTLDTSRFNDSPRAVYEALGYEECDEDDTDINGARYAYCPESSDGPPQIDVRAYPSAGAAAEQAPMSMVINSEGFAYLVDNFLFWDEDLAVLDAEMAKLTGQ